MLMLSKLSSKEDFIDTLSMIDREDHFRFWTSNMNIIKTLIKNYMITDDTPDSDMINAIISFSFFCYCKEWDILEEYAILKDYVTTVIQKDRYDPSTLDSVSFILAPYNSLFLNVETFDKYELQIKTLLGNIIDAFIATESPYEMINRIYTHVRNQTPTMVIHDSVGAPTFTADEKKVYFYFIDVLTREDVKQSFYLTLKAVYETNTFMSYKDDIVSRYSKYFDYDTDEMIYDIIDSFQTKNNDVCLTQLSDIVDKWATIYPAESEVYIMFIREVVSKLANAVNHLPTQYITDKDDMVVLEAISKFDFTSALEATTTAKNINKTSTKIYGAYKTYKNAEDKVDAQITKGVNVMKGVLTGDVRKEIVEGKEFSAIGFLKKLLGTVAIFSFGPIKAAIALVVRYTMKKNTTIAERKKIILELQSEIEIITMKIDDAASDGDREAKYAMTRTKTELENALNRIKYGLEADQKSINTAKGLVRSVSGK